MPPRPGALTLVQHAASSFQCQLSLNSIRALGLIPDGRACGRKRWSLQGTLEPYLTSGAGRRLLRASLLQPSTSESTIINRQEAIGELLEHATELQRVHACLKGGPKDLDRMLIQLSDSMVADCAGTLPPKKVGAVITAVIQLRDLLRWLQELQACLAPLSSALLASIRDSAAFPDLKALLADMENVLDADVEQSRKPALHAIQQCYCIRAGACSFLDAAKSRFNAISEQVSTQMEKYTSMEVEGGKVSLTYTRARSWHLVFKRSKRAPGHDRLEVALGGDAQSDTLLPKGWWELGRGSQGQILCTNQELTALNQRLERAAAECRHLSVVQLSALSDRVQARLPQLRCLLDALALLDMLVGFAAFAADRSSAMPFCRPTILPHPGPLIIKTGYHPSHGEVDPLSSSKRVMQPNDVYLSQACSLGLVLGANMGGKSTYLRQTGVLVVMAQTGLLVPCAEMALHPFRAICSRVGTGDNLLEKQSSMMVEAQDVVELLDVASSGALVLIDELGRATSTCDGIALAWAVAEELIGLGAFTLFATHFAELQRLADVYPPVAIWHMQVLQKGRCVQHTHRCVSGRPAALHYGLALAAQVGLPEDVQETAQALCSRLDKEEGLCFEPNPSCAAERELLVLMDEFSSACRQPDVSDNVVAEFKQRVADWLRANVGLTCELDASQSGAGNGAGAQAYSNN